MKRRKTLVATPTGIELIGLIQNELLKSAELTGLWEKKLRQIEHHEYGAQQFIAELKTMVTAVVNQVLADNSGRRVTASAATGKAALPPKLRAAAEAEPSAEKPKRKVIREGSVCPECGQGRVIKGHSAYGCSRWREGCRWTKPFPKKKSKNT